MALPEMKIVGLDNEAAQKEIRSRNMQSILTGRADYVNDRKMAGMLWATTKHATISHGTVKTVDASKALALPGVKAVFTYDDITAGTGAAAMFPQKTVLYWGAPVAVIVADDWYTAERAINLVNVEYDVLPAVVKTTDVVGDDGVAVENAPLSGRLADTNYANSMPAERGDVAAGLKASAYTKTYNLPWTTTHQHAPIEQYTAFAYWIEDDVYVYLSTQNIHGHRTIIRNRLQIPLNKIHCFNHYCGGGHGQRLNNEEAAMVAAISRKLGGVPVMWRCSKKHSMLFAGRQHDDKGIFTMGCDKDGKIVALDCEYWTTNYGSTITPIISATFTIPNLKWVGHGTYLNQPDRCAWRCVNDPPTAVHLTMAMDDMAEHYNMNPYEFRKKNIMGEHDLDQDSGDPFCTKEVNECMETVVEKSGYLSKWHKPGTKTLSNGRMHGIGLHAHHDSHGRVNGNDRGAVVLMTPDGTILTENGGSKPHNAPTEMNIIVAEVLGAKVTDVNCGDYGNTDVTLNGGMHGGSSFTGSCGAAFYSAAMDLKKKLFTYAITREPFAAEGAKVEDLDSKDSVIFMTKKPDVKATFANIMATAQPMAGIGVGWHAQQNATATVNAGLQREKDGFPVGHKAEWGSAAASVTEVEVDPETGEVFITGHWNSVGCGRVIYKDGVLQQMGSGSELQYAQALYYGDIHDPATGAIIGTQYTESQLPTTLDIDPTTNYLYPVEGDDHAGPLGAHGIGEPCVGSYASILAAIYNAIGKWVDPDHGACNPDRVLKALGKA